MMKRFIASLTMLLVSCGVVTSQSIYEGFRTQQSVKDAGTTQSSPAKMGTYDAYEKEREKLKTKE
jgi:hypothetical protein